MKKVILLLIVAISTNVLFFQISKPCAPLEPAPVTIAQMGEIAIRYNQNLDSHFNSLTPQERVFTYNLFRASLPGNIIAADQSHRHSLKIRRMLESILDHQDKLKVKFLDSEKFIKQITTYLVYLWTNHSQYFVREHKNEKRTPKRLNLDLLNKKNLSKALTLLKFPNALDDLEEVSASLFDASVEPSKTVQNSIEHSAVNFYSPDFTEEDFNKIKPNIQSILNAYFYIDTHSGSRLPAHQRYSVNEKYGTELSAVVYWLQKAYEHTKKYPEQFDKHLIQSIAYLIDFFKTGEEELFKKHSIEWLKSTSRVDYCCGFIETYSDPKSYRATFQSDVTIKALDMTKVNNLLPQLEAQLPFPHEFMRNFTLDNMNFLNASINVKTFSAGGLGPLNIILAYCLPNYEEIRSVYGSKQIIYYPEKPVEELINPDIYHRLFNANSHYEWAQLYDPQFELDKDLLMLHVLLHETLGHGSGKLATHTFQEGDCLSIDGATYNIGNTIQVTGANIPQLLAGYDHAIEELRAEIISLLSSIISFDDLATAGLYKNWSNKLEKRKLLEMVIISMVRFGLSRMKNIAEDTTEITGDHARANTALNNYLIDHGGLEIVEEPIVIDGKDYVVIDALVYDLDKTIAAIKELAQLTQEIKSTGNGQKAQWLIETYGSKIRNMNHLKNIKKNFKAIAGDIKVVATLYPDYKPIISNNKIIDIAAEWPSSIADQYMKYRDLTYKMD